MPLNTEKSQKSDRIGTEIAQDDCARVMLNPGGVSGVTDGGVDAIVGYLETEFKSATTASPRVCTAVAQRLADEVRRICTESQRIQASGDVDGWMLQLARHRLQQCLRYYQRGASRARADLHGTLSAIVYRYIAPARTRATYQARVTAIEDFLQGFYVESLNAFRRENEVEGTYSPRVMLELAEYMAFVERYGKRRIPLPGRRSQQLAILRAQTFAKQQPPETSIDIERAAEGGGSDGDAYTWDDASVQQVREVMGAQESTDVEDASLRRKVIEELIDYLRSKKQEACIDYLTLRLKDMTASEIEQVLDLTPRERDYLQQRFRYHLIRFALQHRWELVHQWLDADLGRNLGLLPHQWDVFWDGLDETDRAIVKGKRSDTDDRELAQQLGMGLSQMQRQWFKVLEAAWELRNNPESGTGESTDE